MSDQRFNTGNPIGSNSPLDRSDNTRNLDLAVNAPQDTFQDRLGKSRLTWAGMESGFGAGQVSREQRFRAFIASSGYQFAGDYAAGIEITEYNQLVRDENGEFWRVSGQVDLPYVTTGAGIPEDDALVPAGDAVLRQDLANPDIGAVIVASKLPFPLTSARTVGSRLDDIVSVSDFSGDPTTKFQNALSEAQSYGSSLFIPRLNAGGKYIIEQDIVVPDGMTVFGGGSIKHATRAQGGSHIELHEASLIARGNSITLRDFAVSRAGSTPGAAIDCYVEEAPGGFYHNYFDNVSVIGSNDVGAIFGGGWLFTWINPYIRSCRLGMVVTTGAHSTGMNSMTLVGGEIQANSEVGLVLDRCKQFNLVGTCVEGNYGPGIGIGNVLSVNMLAYFEANQGGHIRPYSYNGGIAGMVNSLTIQGGSYVYRGSSEASAQPYDVPAIEIPGVRQFTMEPGVFAHGWANTTTEIIQVEDVGDSNRGVGSITGIYTDAPADKVLRNDCFGFGTLEVKSVGVNVEIADDATSIPFALPLVGTLARNPSRFMRASCFVKAAVDGGVAFVFRAFDSTGVQVGQAVTGTTQTVGGFGTVSASLADSNDVAYITATRAGSSPADTATGVTLINIEAHTHNNRVKNV